MTAPAIDTSPRFVVEKHGPCNFYVFDSETGVSCYPCFTRRGARKVADRKNVEHRAKETR